MKQENSKEELMNSNHSPQKNFKNQWNLKTKHEETDKLLAIETDRILINQK